MSDLHATLWWKVEADLRAAAPGFDPDQHPPLIRWTHELDTIGYFVVCHDTDSFPRVVLRRIPNKSLTCEASTIAHEHGHFLQWRENQAGFEKVLDSYRALKASRMTLAQAIEVLCVEADAWRRGWRTLKETGANPLERLITFAYGLNALSSYLWVFSYVRWPEIASNLKSLNMSLMMKSFSFGLACAFSFSYLFGLHAGDGLPMIAAWALYAWIRQQEIQAKELSCEEDCECACDEDEEVAEEADASVASPSLPIQQAADPHLAADK